MVRQKQFILLNTGLFSQTLTQEVVQYTHSLCPSPPVHDKATSSPEFRPLSLSQSLSTGGAQGPKHTKNNAQSREWPLQSAQPLTQGGPLLSHSVTSLSPCRQNIATGSSLSIHGFGPQYHLAASISKRKVRNSIVYTSIQLCPNQDENVGLEKCRKKVYRIAS